jgi:hypothetical protein
MPLRVTCRPSPDRRGSVGESRGETGDAASATAAADSVRWTGGSAENAASGPTPAGRHRQYSTMYSFRFGREFPRPM